MLGADVGLAVTGVAGPAEQDGQPVGTVFVGLVHRRRVGSGACSACRATATGCVSSP